MSRTVRDWTPDKVEEAVVAPHRYTFNDFDDSYRDAKTFAEFREGCPYKKGEVVWVESFDKEGNPKPVRARILYVFPDRDWYGERREIFRIQRETKAGTWSKLWEYVYPGHIQRGYQQAGLAPDVP